MDEQDVRLHCCGFNFIIRTMQYDVVIPRSCAVQIYYDGDGILNGVVSVVDEQAVRLYAYL